MLRVRIISSDDDGGTSVLCDSPDPLPRHGLRVNGNPVMQLADLVRADFGKVFNRKNRRPRISFNVTRNTDEAGNLFDSELDALMWALDHVCTDCVVHGDVELTIGDGSGEATRWISGAGIEDLGMVQQIGCSVVMAYAIVGGTYRKSHPTNSGGATT